MQAVEPRIKADIMGILTVESAVAARTSFGGTAPVEVKARIADARSRFAVER
jgi:argininosuccinate lyase